MIAMIRSPASRPIVCAGDVTPAWISGATVPTTRVAAPATVLLQVAVAQTAGRQVTESVTLSDDRGDRKSVV